MATVCGALYIVFYLHGNGGNLETDFVETAYYRQANRERSPGLEAGLAAELANGQASGFAPNCYVFDSYSRVFYEGYRPKYLKHVSQ